MVPTTSLAAGSQATRAAAPGTRRAFGHETVEERIETAVHEGQQIGSKLQHATHTLYVTHL